LDSAGAAILGAGEAEVGRLDLEKAGDGIDCIHCVLVLLVKGKVEVFTAELGEIASLVAVVAVVAASPPVLAGSPVVRSAVGSAVCSTVRSAIRSAVGTAVGSAVGSTAVIGPLCRGRADDTRCIGGSVNAGLEDAPDFLPIVKSMSKRVNKRQLATNLMDDTTLRSISDRVKRNSPLLRSHRLLGLDIFVELDQPLGGRLAEQVNNNLAVFFRDMVDLGLIFGLRGWGRGLAIKRGLRGGSVSLTDTQTSVSKGGIERTWRRGVSSSG
jgi:hypothetical protein